HPGDGAQFARHRDSAQALARLQAVRRDRPRGSRDGQEPARHRREGAEAPHPAEVGRGLLVREPHQPQVRAIDVTISIALQFVVVLAAIWMGARSSGVGLGLWGAVGLLILVAVFGVNPTSPPVDVMLIILAVIMAASVMEAAGGIDFLVRIAERVIRANPKYVTIVAPLTTWSFSFVAGTGHIVYPLLPVIYETAHQSGIRPERPMAVATIASQQAITASPVAAATAAMIGLFAEKGMTRWGLPQILMICVPSTLAGVVVAAIVSTFLG